ncbi:MULTISPECIES: respiratory nitrate reductase subunit gamma [Marinobacter]|jgi:nitrate reductase gamma subunit|uniref:Respiratory nitrate reductase subunit gamma n=1 Tax=Marinobacter alkaliphilus TaxID=254719 RepID=A0ABZ3E0K4_9GAMM|nr:MULTISPECIES: respiratory nitrate reductase subunit gamma [Marinobacter]MAP32183.1 respiratory nitrate reductase subunit gamma [Marinobacter sp.]PSF12536.1 respiratory nitrate reductase subunit gamma [Marinobacter shengliensis]|tara:strand:+ start:728 stop:1405 length:678 start_codon:yes stop_codon:yes gene_type:complete
MSYLHTLVFGVYPYIALAVLFIGTWARYDHGQFTWKAHSSQMLRKKNMVLASVLFHVGILVIFFGHLVGLLAPKWAYEWLMTPGQKQVMAVVVGGIAGVMCLIGGAMLAYRRLTDPRVRASSTVADNLVIIILVVQVALGLATILPTMGHLDGSEMLKFSAWAQGVLTLQGGVAGHIADVHWIYKTHIFLGLTIFVLFPFTRLVHMLSVPVEYFGRKYQVVRKRA